MDLTVSRQLDPAIIASIVLRGDLSGLNETQAVDYYNYRCAQVGIDPSAKPFDILILNGKRILYANASATQQLSSTHGLSISIINRERIEAIYCVTVRVTAKDGRSTENQGAVDLAGQSGERLANSIMKATTKAIRRTVLAHCGLGMLDETEVETIPGAQVVAIPIPNVPAISAVLDRPYKVQLPTDNGSPAKTHSSYDHPQEWIGGVFEIVGKIAASTKLSNEEKNAKLVNFFQANRETFDHLRSYDKTDFLGRVAAHKAEKSWAESKQDYIIEEELTT
jgi:hypothetical protein